MRNKWKTALLSRLLPCGGLPRRLAPPTRGRRPREEVKALWGQSLFEVLFAIAIAALILVGVVSLAAFSVRNAAFSNSNALATKYNQEASEWLRGERDADWTVFSGYASGSGTTWCLPSLITWPGSSGSCGDESQIAGTIFFREATLILSDSDGDSVDDTVRALIVVSWNDAQGAHEVRSVTHLTNWRR